MQHPWDGNLLKRTKLLRTDNQGSSKFALTGLGCGYLVETVIAPNIEFDMRCVYVRGGMQPEHTLSSPTSAANTHQNLHFALTRLNFLTMGV